MRGGGIKHNSTRHELQSTLGDTLRRRDFDRSERCPKSLAFLETLAERKTYRGFASASPNPTGSHIPQWTTKKHPIPIL